MRLSPAFEQELHKLGHIEGRNIVIQRRYTHGSLEAAGRLAMAIVEFRSDVTLVSNGEMAWAVLRATKQIPIVVAAAGDLLAAGLIDSLAKPGGKVTGLQVMSETWRQSVSRFFANRAERRPSRDSTLPSQAVSWRSGTRPRAGLGRLES